MIDRERARDGRFVEIIGHYNPRRTPPEIVLKRERVDYWIGQGARAFRNSTEFLEAGSGGSGPSTDSSRLGDEVAVASRIRPA